MGALACPPVPVAPGATSTVSSVLLEWTAPGDDGNVGQASRYDLRYSPAPVGADTALWWNSAAPATGMPAPSPAGATDSVHVGDLAPGTSYYFVVQALDDVGLRSPFSNVLLYTTPPDPGGCQTPSTPPAAFAVSPDTGTVALSWSATTDPLATALHVYRGVGTSGILTLTVTLPSGQTQYRDSGLQTGTFYRYRIAWASACGDGPSSPTLATQTLGGSTGTTSTEAKPAIHAHPNPSSGSVQFSLTVPGPTAAEVRIRLFDMTGHWVAHIAEGSLAAGQHTVTWSRMGRTGERVAPGYYEALGTIGEDRVRERIVLLP